MIFVDPPESAPKGFYRTSKFTATPANTFCPGAGACETITLAGVGCAGAVGVLVCGGVPGAAVAGGGVIDAGVCAGGLIEDGATEDGVTEDGVAEVAPETP